MRQPCHQPSPSPHLNTHTPQGPRWLAKLLAWWFSQLMHVCGARCTVDVATPPDAARRHMVVWHPHGAYTCMALMHCGRHTVNGLPLRWYPGVAPVLFATPGFREALLLLNARSVDGRTMESLAAAGLTLGVQPGGIPEQLISDSSREVAVFSERAGFVRLAMKHGTALLPAYIFGENQACAARRHAAAPPTSAHRRLRRPQVRDGPVGARLLGVVHARHRRLHRSDSREVGPAVDRAQGGRHSRALGPRRRRRAAQRRAD